MKEALFTILSIIVLILLGFLLMMILLLKKMWVMFEWIVIMILDYLLEKLNKDNDGND